MDFHEKYTKNDAKIGPQMMYFLELLRNADYVKTIVVPAVKQCFSGFNDQKIHEKNTTNLCKKHVRKSDAQNMQNL